VVGAFSEDSDDKIVGQDAFGIGCGFREVPNGGWVFVVESDELPDVAARGCRKTQLTGRVGIR
jgi:hypothetical protein